MTLIGNSEEASVAADRPVHVSGRSERQEYVHARSVLSCCPDQAALRQVVTNSPPKEFLVRRTIVFAALACTTLVTKKKLWCHYCMPVLR